MDEKKDTTSHQAGYIGLVIGAARATKRLPFHKLEEICREAQHPLMLLGGPEDSDTAKKLAVIDPIKIYNACGQFNINESAALEDFLLGSLRLWSRPVRR